ncbi:MAG: hypothetical protein LC799_09155 [Actinobacteria bacterium]|nr:hypothetical protein [Actinomycetota bacterium]
MGRGRRPRLTDTELLTLAVEQVLLGVHNEHRWMRLAYCRLGHLFRYLPNQPGYHQRLKAAAPLLAAAITHLARVSPSWCDQLRLVDATPVPCAASRETVKRSELAGCSSRVSPATSSSPRRASSSSSRRWQSGSAPAVRRNGPDRPGVAATGAPAVPGRGAGWGSCGCVPTRARDRARAAAHPHHPTSARPRRSGLAQLDHRHPGQAPPHPLQRERLGALIDS